MTLERDPLAETLTGQGFTFLRADETRNLIGWTDDAWQSFAASWDRLGPDRYMADGGRYRSRRHAAFEVSGDQARRKRHQPHYQSRDYNRHNGDVQRWFEPLADSTAASAILAHLYATITPRIDCLVQRKHGSRWHSEVHQFRIETSSDEIGRPTPEGLHRDGVDWVLVILIARHNVVEGVTEIGDAKGQPLGSFTLSEPGDAVLLDDRRIRHGVTPILPASKDSPAWRDALVVTWSAGDHLQGP